MSLLINQQPETTECKFQKTHRLEINQQPETTEFKHPKKLLACQKTNNN